MTSHDEIKACCAAAYGHDVVSLILGDSYRPGGAALTRRLGRALRLRPGMRVADLASGPGTTARLLAAEFGAHVDGVDLSAVAVARATEAAADAGLQDRVHFHLGDAEALPLPDGGVDAAVCECALCTFPDKAAAAAEFARITAPARLTAARLDSDRVEQYLTLMRAAVDEGLIGYCLLVACKPDQEQAR